MGLLEHGCLAGYLRDPLYKNSFFIVLGNVFNAGCGFLFWAAAARLYSVEDVGLATALISSLGMVALLSVLGFNSSMIRFFPVDDRAGIIGTSLAVTTAASLLVGAAYILFIDSISPPLAFVRGPVYALVFLALGALSSVAGITGNAFVAARRADHYLYQNLFMAVRVPLLLPLVLFGAFGVIGSIGLAYLAASLFALLILNRSFSASRLRIDRGFLHRSLKFSSWNYVSSVLTLAPGLILPVMMLNMVGEALAAKYYIASTIGNIVLIVPAALSTSLFVEGSHGEELRKSVIRAGGASLAVLLPAVALICLFGDRMLGLFGEEYLESFALLRILALSSFPVTIYSLFIPIQNVRMEVGSIVWLNSLRFVLLIGLSYILVLRYGITGAGYGWMITYGVLALGIAGVARREGWI